MAHPKEGRGRASSQLARATENPINHLRAAGTRTAATPIVADGADRNTAVEWRDCLGWSGIYQASDRGDLRSLDRVVDTPQGPRRLRGVVLAQTPYGGPDGPLTVSLSRDGARRTRRVAHLVLEAFGVLRPGPKAWAWHRNGDRRDCSLRNLAWTTPSEFKRARTS